MEVQLGDHHILSHGSHDASPTHGTTPPDVRQDGRTATPSLKPAGSSSHAHRAPMEARAALLAVNELLRYRPVDDLYEEWLDRVAELVRAAWGSPTPSHSLPPPQPAAGDGGST